MRKGQVLELQIDSAGFEGVAVGRHEEFVVFVRNAVPGDRVRVLVRRKRKKFAEASLEEILEPSPSRVEPRCPHFGACGGCRWQNTSYPVQLEFKRQQVRDLFQRIGRLPPVEIRPTLPSPTEFHYRNKMEFTFGNRRWLTLEEVRSGEPVERDFALGLHIPGRFDRILDLDVCYLQRAPSAAIVNHVREVAVNQGWSAYNTTAHTGYLRNLVIRTGENTDEIMVNVITSRAVPERTELLMKGLLESFPGITTLINSINATRSPVAAGEEIVCHGPGVIRERIGQVLFTIGPTTFFQPNTCQAERLYGTVRDLAGLDGSQVVFDLYSGIGGIALSLSDRARRIVGVESDVKAVEAGRSNAVLNGIDNCEFFAGDVSRAFLPEFLREQGKPDVLILDPPRAGLNETLIRAIVQNRPPRIVYVSCNPATQARDLAVLCNSYRIEAVQPVDMFPHTHHIENVAALTLV